MIESTLIWRGNRRTRSLMVKDTNGRPVFFVPGNTVPAGTISDELVERYVADGRLERVTPAQTAQRSIATIEVVDEMVRERIEPTPVRNDYSITTNEPTAATIEETVPRSAPCRKFGPKKKVKNGSAE